MINRLKPRKIKQLVVLSVILLSTCLTIQKLISESNGYTGALDGGCSCHSSQSASTTVTASIAGGSWSVKPNTAYDITVTVNNSSKPYCGFDAGVKDATSGGSNVGTLTAKTGCKVQSGELTHSGRQTMSGGKFDFVFTWTSPATAGTYYLRSVGNATNGQSTSNCAWAFMSNQTITVTGITAIGAPASAANICIGTSTNITWTQVGISNVKIELSTDGGSNFNTTIVASTPAASSSYSWNVPGNQTPSNTAMIRISDASDATTSLTSGVFSLASAPQIITQPQSKTVCTGQNTTLTVTTGGSGYNYQWKKGTTNVGTNSSTLTLNNLQSSDAGDYTCVITNPTCNTNTTSSVATLTVNTGITITTQPTNQSACVGGTATFSPVVSAGAGATYQWQKAGIDLAGQVAPTLTLANIQIADAGNYVLKISNNACNLVVTSNIAALTVNSTPAITTQPQATSACVGKTATFSVLATGTGLTYQWRKDGVAISGATTTSYTTSALTLDNAGDYDVLITGTCGTPLASSLATLTIKTPPTIVNQPKNITAKVGGTATFSVDGGVGTSLTYVWKKGGVVINGQSGPTLVLDNIKLSDSGDYQVFVSNDCGTTASNLVKLSVKLDKLGPNIQTSVSTISFANLATGTSHDTTIKALIKNTGDQVLNVTKIIIDPASQNSTDFQSLSTAIPYQIDPGKTIDVDLRFSPKQDGLRKANLRIESDATSPNDVVTVALNGTGYTDASQPSVSISKSDLDFGIVDVGKFAFQTFSMKNLGNKTVKVLSAKVNNPYTLSTPLLPDSILAGANLEFSVKFSPISAGLFQDKLSVVVEGITNPFVVNLNGVSVLSSVDDYLSSENNYLKITPNPQTTNSPISFEIKNSEIKELEIISQNGQLIDKLNVQGMSSYNWNCNNVNGVQCENGVYFLRIKSNSFNKIIKFMIVR